MILTRHRLAIVPTIAARASSSGVLHVVDPDGSWTRISARLEGPGAPLLPETLSRRQLIPLLAVREFGRARPKA